ncbi:MAG TPA: response regulator transcription factor [Anaerolineae bacterium]|nr:response regulator transcription factor [Anaerolineae bacterium]HMR65842.1 response regulator transcription factor [Anaerolineae bacterium]
MTKHILLVDDDRLMRRSLALNLEEAGYRASTVATAEAALEVVQHQLPDLILLDIGLPGLDGLDALRILQQAARTQYQKEVPIIFLTARRRELDQALGLELGADDYVTKPFNLSVLLARIKAVLRRVERTGPATTEPEAVVIGKLVIDAAAHIVSLENETIDLTPLEFAMLHTLALKAGYVVSVNELLERVWGAEYVGEPQIVYVYIRSLRQKLEQDSQRPQRLVTIRGVGYKLDPTQL